MLGVFRNTFERQNNGADVFVNFCWKFLSKVYSDLVQHYFCIVIIFCYSFKTHVVSSVLWYVPGLFLVQTIDIAHEISQNLLIASVVKDVDK